MGRSKGEANLNLSLSYFPVGPSIIIWVGPNGWGEGGGNWLSVSVFRMRWEHLSFAVCFVFDNIMLGLEPDNSAQSLECKFVGIKTSHSDHLV